MPTITDLTWMAGQWAGTGFEGHVEEHWSAPDGGCMIGMFRLVKEGQVGVLEFETITQEANGVILRFKHFNTALESWEDTPLTFRLEQVTDTEAIFVTTLLKRVEGKPRRIIYSRPEPDALYSRIESWPESEDAEPMSFELHKRRVQPAP
ncbi:MAG: hypothetical protein JW910_09685 [Anaerolineae bacterium]|nr:hypothetical protein [Anaerolineae bacterium]